MKPEALWYGAGHALSAMTTGHAALWPMRALTMPAAAVFTPQAAAAIGHLAAPRERGRAIIFVFLVWSVASVIGLPLSAWTGETLGWGVAFDAVGALALMTAVWVWFVFPDGVKPAALTLRACKGVLTHPVLVAMVAVTALFGAGQFTLFTCITPQYKHALGMSLRAVRQAARPG